MTAPPPARFQYATANRKLAPVERVPYPHKQYKYRPTPRAPFCCATFVSIEATCSEECVFKRGPNGERGGCYVDADQFMRRAMEVLDAGARGRNGFEVILEEAAAIDAAWGDPSGWKDGRGRAGPWGAGRIPQDGYRGRGRDLRLHVGGDVPSTGAALVLAAAADRWRARGGGAVWTYTHAWRVIERAAFGGISVLASVETPRQVRAARARGYAPALVVQKFPHGKRPFQVAGTRFIPCPAETLGKTCVECRICLDVDLEAKNLGIAFEVHGQQAHAVRSELVQLRVGRSPERRAVA